MLGLVGYRENGVQAPCVRTIRGVRFCAVYVPREPGFFTRTALRSACRTLRREGVRRAVFLVEARQRAYFETRGVAGISAVPLHRATAAAIARWYLEQAGTDMGAATVAFAAQAVTQELRAAAAELAGAARYITLCVASGGEELARSLRRERGVAARVASPGEPLCATLTLCFDPCVELPGAAVRLYDPALRVEYADDLPDTLLAALWHAGALDAEKLKVESAELA